MYKVRVARNVLKAIQRRLSKIEESGIHRLHLEHYQNCREQGFLIVNFPTTPLLNTKWLAFAENRNSDNIVVYPGQNNFVPETSIDEDSYKHRVYFGPEEINKAAHFCVDYLLGK